MTASAPAPAVRARIERKVFLQNGQPIVLLDGFTLDVRAGEYVVVLGPSGCGKTTLLRILGGLDTDFDGSVTAFGEAVRGPSRRCGFLFQDPRLLPWLSVAGNLAFAMPPDTPSAEKRAQVAGMLDLIGLGSHERIWPAQLSGGMAKRVALARTLLAGPDIFLLDEPFTGLDVPTKYAIHDHVARLAHGATVVQTTHDIEEAVYLCDRIIVLSATRGHQIDEIAIDLPRPRQRHSHAFRQACADTFMRVLAHWTEASPDDHSPSIA